MLRLREVIAEVIHVDQTYCVPSRLISDYITLIWHVLEVSGSLAIDTALAMDMRQGCPLSGKLYSPAIKPLLHKLRQELTGVVFPGCPASVKLSAFADDVVVVLNTQRDICVIEENLGLFNRLSSAKVNKEKSEAVSVKKDSLSELVLLGGLCWKTGGMKNLGVVLGDELFLKKYWDGVLESVQGRLKRWRWLLPSVSFRGRTLISDSLAAAGLCRPHLESALRDPGGSDGLLLGQTTLASTGSFFSFLKRREDREWCTWPAGALLSGSSSFRGYCID